MATEVILGTFFFKHLAQGFLREKKKSHQSGKLSVQEIIRNGHTWFHVVYTTETEIGTVTRRAVVHPESERPARPVGSEAVGLSGAGEWDTPGANRRGTSHRRRDGRLGEDE